MSVRAAPFAVIEGSALTGAAVRLAAGGIARGERLVQDSADCAGTASTLEAAAETIINLASSAGAFRAGERGTDIVVGQHITGANNHRGMVRRPIASDALVGEASGCRYPPRRSRRQTTLAPLWSRSPEINHLISTPVLPSFLGRNVGTHLFVVILGGGERFEEHGVAKL
jgi:hypothetical protein